MIRCCMNQCPVLIDIPWLNINLGERLNRTGERTALGNALGSVTGAAKDDRSAPISKMFFANYDYFAKWGTQYPSISNLIAGGGEGIAHPGKCAPSSRKRANVEEEEKVSMARGLMERWIGLDHRRALPAFPKETLVQAAAAQRLETPLGKGRETKVVLFADVFTNYGMVNRGVAAIEVLRALGADVVVSESVPEGRAALSQGMIATAKQHARRALMELDRHVNDGRDIVVVEPSSLSM